MTSPETPELAQVLPAQPITENPRVTQARAALAAAIAADTATEQEQAAALEASPPADVPHGEKELSASIPLNHSLISLLKNTKWEKARAARVAADAAAAAFADTAEMPDATSQADSPRLSASPNTPDARSDQSTAKTVVEHGTIGQVSAMNPQPAGETHLQPDETQPQPGHPGKLGNTTSNVSKDADGILGGNTSNPRLYTQIERPSNDEPRRPGGKVWDMISSQTSKLSEANANQHNASEVENPDPFMYPPPKDDGTQKPPNPDLTTTQSDSSNNSVNSFRFHSLNDKNLGINDLNTPSNAHATNNSIPNSMYMAQNTDGPQHSWGGGRPEDREPYST